MPDETYGTCQLHGCTTQASVIVVTIREGFCFERCPTHAREIDWMSRETR